MVSTTVMGSQRAKLPCHSRLTARAGAAIAAVRRAWRSMAEFQSRLPRTGVTSRARQEPLSSSATPLPAA